MISSPMESIPFHQIVWLDKPGPGGGGGGGGNRMQAPPRKAEGGQADPGGQAPADADPISEAGRPAATGARPSGEATTDAVDGHSGGDRPSR